MSRLARNRQVVQGVVAKGELVAIGEGNTLSLAQRKNGSLNHVATDARVVVKFGRRNVHQLPVLLAKEQEMEIHGSSADDAVVQDMSRPTRSGCFPAGNANDILQHLDRSRSILFAELCVKMKQ